MERQSHHGNCCANLLCDCCGLQGLSRALAGRHLMRFAHRFARQKTEGLPVLWACTQSWFLLCSTRVCLLACSKCEVGILVSFAFDSDACFGKEAVNFLTASHQKEMQTVRVSNLNLWKWGFDLLDESVEWKSGCSARAHIVSHFFTFVPFIRLNCVWKSCGGSSVHKVSIVAATAFPGVLHVTAHSLAHIHTWSDMYLCTIFINCLGKEKRQMLWQHQM